jgi:hypothetical protein
MGDWANLEGATGYMAVTPFEFLSKRRERRFRSFIRCPYSGFILENLE